MKKSMYAFILLAIIVGFSGCKNKTEAAKMQNAKEITAENSPDTEYVVQREASKIYWKGSKPTGFHTGTIEVKNGFFKISGSRITNGTVILDMTSITDTDLQGEYKEKLENHLKGTVAGKEGDFFDVNKFPEATFEVTGMVQRSNESYLEGNLTMKSITKNIEFPVKISVENDTLRLSSEVFTIDRTKWGINYMSKTIFDGLGDKFVSDDIELKLDIKAVQK